MKKIFYRVCNTDTQQGLWYDYQGKFTGLIHYLYSFCKNQSLKMPYDAELVGFLSATDTIESLFNWFSREDIIKLQQYGYFIYEYEATNAREYKNHWVIEKASSRPVNRIALTPIQ